VWSCKFTTLYCCTSLSGVTVLFKRRNRRCLLHQYVQTCLSYLPTAEDLIEIICYIGICTEDPKIISSIAYMELTLQ
jgi:hypothetical protein